MPSNWVRLEKTGFKARQLPVLALQAIVDKNSTTTAFLMF